MINADYLINLKERVSVFDVIKRKVPQTTGMATDCPFCKKPNLIMNVRQSRWVCTACGLSGDQFKFIMFAYSKTFDEAIEIMSELSAGLYRAEIPNTVSEMFPHANF